MDNSWGQSSDQQSINAAVENIDIAFQSMLKSKLPKSTSTHLVFAGVLPVSVKWEVDISGGRIRWVGLSEIKLIFFESIEGDWETCTFLAGSCAVTFNELPLCPVLPFQHQRMVKKGCHWYFCFLEKLKSPTWERFPCSFPLRFLTCRLLIQKSENWAHFIRKACSITTKITGMI